VPTWERDLIDLEILILTKPWAARFEGGKSAWAASHQPQPRFLVPGVNPGDWSIPGSFVAISD